MHNGHRISDQILLLELHALDLLRNKALYIWHGRVRVSGNSLLQFSR